MDLKVVVVGHGECRDIIEDKDSDGKVVELHPQEVKSYLDMTFDGSKPVRVYIPTSVYDQVILPQIISRPSQFRSV